MKVMTVNQDVLRLLQPATSLAEVRDAQGTLLGFFVPASVEDACEYARAAAHFEPRYRPSSERTIHDSGGSGGSGVLISEQRSIMITLTVDNATRALLRQTTEPVEIRDGDGNVIGFFAPSRGRLTEAELAELDRRRATEGQGLWKTTREVFEHLKTLTDNPADLADLQRHIDELAERDRRNS